MAERAGPDTILACPNCGTRYRAPGPILGRPDATYRCARCQHVFSIGDAGDTEKPPDLSFDLDEEPTEEDDSSLAATATGAGAPAFVAAPPEVDEPPPELPPEPAFMKRSPMADQPEDSDMGSGRTLSGLRLGVRFEALVLVVFGAIGLYLAAYPLDALELVGRIPLLGSTLRGSPQPLDRVYVTDLTGTHVLLKGDRPAFVIAGSVVNDSNSPIGAVQVEGYLYDDAEEVARKMVFAGVKASQRLVKDWTPAEIEVFERITPPKRYTLASGDSDKFLIIFQEVPPDVSEFGCRLVAAKPATGG